MDIRGPADPNPIKPTQPPGGPDSASGPTGPKETPGADFRDSMETPGATPAGGPSAADGPASIEAPSFDRIAPIIQEGVAQNLSRDEILQNVVQDQVKRQFGDLATPKLTETITQRFQSDPNLRSIFNELYRQANRD